jgi:selenide,water dikinase
VLTALAGLTPQALVQLIGSGAAAIELAFALRQRGFQLELFLKESCRYFWSRFESALDRAGVNLKIDVKPGPADLRLLCTGSRGPEWFKQTGLGLDPNGRLLTNANLQVQGQPLLFASGDCAVINQQPRPASGVWAVRAAPILAANLRRVVQGKALRNWQPQNQALQLIGDSNGHVYGQWGGVGWGPSRWSWQLKQRLDQTFMAKLQPSALAMAAGHPQITMACSGCAAKLGAQPLANALKRLGVQAAPVDAAAFGDPIGPIQWLQSIDGFPALVADPWLNARLSLLHACSDLWASGAQLHSVQVLVQLPRCDANLQENLLLQSLAGIKSVLDPCGAELLGGHSLQALEPPISHKPLSQQMLLALSVNGQAPKQQLWQKGPLHAGDVLLLSRPLGIGVLFAAAMVGATKPLWLDAALEQMQQSQADLVPLLAAHGCHACTDITGFGLLGHLGEMMALSPGVALHFENPQKPLPALPGALELLGQGYQSSLAPSNGAVLKQWPALLKRQWEAAVQLLLDPQTCGPLLAAIPAALAPACLLAMQQAGFNQAAIIARVEPINMN